MKQHSQTNNCVGTQGKRSLVAQVRKSVELWYEVSLDWYDLHSSNFTKSTKVVSAILAVAIGLIVLRFNTIPVGSFFDDAHYIVLAESLFHGTGYNLINYPYAPLETAFPPGWPMLLAPLAGNFPTNFILLKLPALFFFLGTILLSFQLYKKRFTPPYLYLLIAFIAVNPSLVGMASSVMSESAFLFWSILTLLLYEQWRKEMKKERLWVLGLVFVTAVFTLMIRSVGIAILVGILMHIIFTIKRQQQRLLLISFVVLALLGTPLIWFNQQNGGMLFFSELYSTHIRYVISEFGSFLRFWQHGEAISAETLANAILPIFELGFTHALVGSQLTRLFAIWLLLLVLLGFFLSLRDFQAQELYFACYLGIFYLWIVYIKEVQPRIILPLIPWLYAYLIVAICWIKERFLPKMPAQFSLSVLFATLFLFNAHTYQNSIVNRVVDLKIGNSWLAQNSASESIIMSPNPVPDYLYGRRLTTHYPRNQEDIGAYIQAQNVDYILIHPPLELWDHLTLDRYMEEHLIPFMESDPHRFKKVFQDDSHFVLIYAVIK